MTEQTPRDKLDELDELIGKIRGVRDDIPRALASVKRAARSARLGFFFALVVLMVGIFNISAQGPAAFMQGITVGFVLFANLTFLVPAEIELHHFRTMDRRSAVDLKNAEDLRERLVGEIFDIESKRASR